MDPTPSRPNPSEASPSGPSPGSAERETQRLYRLAGAGVEFFSTVLGGTGLGWLLDYWLGTKPWCVIGGVAIGFTAGLTMLVRLMNRENAKETAKGKANAKKRET